MSSFSTFLAENSPWKSGAVSVLSSIQKGEKHFDPHWNFVEYKGLDGDFLRGLMQLLHTPHPFYFLQFYHLLLETKIDPVFKSAFNSDIPDDPYSGKWMRENSSGYVLKRIDLFFKQIPEAELPQAAQLAEWLVRFAPDRRAVKWGIMFLGCFQNRNCRDALATLGCDKEFTLFATHALVSLYKNCEQELWDMAKAVNDEEREAPIDCLVNTASSDIQRWMLCEGFSGNSYSSYHLASIFAKTGNLYEKLMESIPDQALLKGAGLIIAELLRVPGSTQDRYPYEKEVLQLFLQHLPKHALDQDLRDTLYAIQHSLAKIDSDTSDEWKDKGWTKHDAMRMLKLLEPFLNDLNLIFHKTTCQLNYEPSCLVFHPKEPLIFIGDASGSITCFNLVGGNKIAEYSGGNASILALGFHLGFLYSFDEGYRLKKWDVNTGVWVGGQAIKPPSNSNMSYDLLACFVPHTPYLVVSFGDGSDLIHNDLIQINIEKSEQTGSYEVDWSGEGHAIASLISSRDGSQLSAFFLGYFGSWGPSHFHLAIEQWNSAACRKTQILRSRDGMDYHHCRYDDGRIAPRQAFSPDGKRLLYTFEGDLYLWEIFRGDHEDAVEYHGNWDATELAWSPINDITAFGRKPGESICFLDINAKQILFQDTPFKSPIKHIEFSNDGNYVATFAKDLQVAVYCMKPRVEDVPDTLLNLPGIEHDEN